ncbi:MAG: cation diffusion facilitator family transporter [Gemmatimonadales bacterium]
MARTATSGTPRTAQINRVLLGLLAANLAVLLAKVMIGLKSGSLAVAGDAVHSSVDAMNNVLALAVSWVAALAPDEDHPYGHRKFETLGALAIVIFLSISGFEVVKGAVSRLISGAEPLDISNFDLAVLAGTLGVNALVALYESRRGRELSSELLLADAAHTKADVFITLGVITGVVLSRAGFGFADPLVALLVAAAIVIIAYGILVRAIPVLVDQHVVQSNQVRASAEHIAGVHRAYNIRSRGSPDQTFAELTIAVEGSATVEQAHLIADAVEDSLKAEFGLNEIVVHVEPC